MCLCNIHSKQERKREGERERERIYEDRVRQQCLHTKFKKTVTLNLKRLTHA